MIAVITVRKAGSMWAGRWRSAPTGPPSRWSARAARWRLTLGPVTGTGTDLSTIQAECSVFTRTWGGQLWRSNSDTLCQQYLVRGEYSVTDNGTVLVCVHGRIGTAGGAFNTFDRIISFTLNLISIVSLTATLLTYITHKQLRNLPGLNLMCLTFSILVSRVKW